MYLYNRIKFLSPLLLASLLFTVQGAHGRNSTKSEKYSTSKSLLIDDSVYEEYEIGEEEDEDYDVVGAELRGNKDALVKKVHSKQCYACLMATPFRYTKDYLNWSMRLGGGQNLYGDSCDPGNIEVCLPLTTDLVQCLSLAFHGVEFMKFCTSPSLKCTQVISEMSKISPFINDPDGLKCSMCFGRTCNNMRKQGALLHRVSLSAALPGLFAVLWFR